MFQILKDVIGKDLSRISLPVYFNEPLSITQKPAEGNEYCELAERAAKEPNLYRRMALLAAYNASRMSPHKDRTLKPFNSLLGETYELVTANYRLVSEQVAHHPPITAYHCESRYYEHYTSQGNSARFNGRNIIVVPKNRTYISLKLPNGTKENYSWGVPPAAIHNLVIGKLYIE